jgi:AraC-like DNA-binding protein
LALAERTDPLLATVDRVVRRTGSVAVGAFRCPRRHPLFADSGPIENDVFVFPRTRVTIAHAGGRRFAADATVVTLYNRGQAYVRGAVDDAGDHCDYFAVERDLALEAALAHDADVDRPFRFDHAPVPAGTYLRQRALFESLARGEAVSDLEVEETVVGLLVSVLDAAYAARGATIRTGDEGDEEDVVRRTRLALGERLGEGLSLAALAREVGVSRGRLCRVFRRRTGTTLHAYREQVRLRAALEALGSPHSADLTGLALDLGYSSHSHFSANFRRAFGFPPSEARRRLGAGAIRSARPRRRGPARS